MYPTKREQTHFFKEIEYMKSTGFGIEVEFTGITRTEAAEVVRKCLNGRTEVLGDSYDTRAITAPNNMIWKIVSDASITCKKKENDREIAASRLYSCELVSPILTYEKDIEVLQEIIRKLRHAGGLTGATEGIHIHLNGSNHTPQSIRNFINIIASKNDLFYKALEIEKERAKYCKRLDAHLVEKMNAKKPQTFKAISDIWYEGYGENINTHYHQSRYHFLNLHSFFTGHHTVELRGFNSELHAGKVRSFVILALALNQQALTQRCASSKKNQTENEKFAMRTYLNRIGLIGEEFKNCREHLTQALGGCSGWRFRSAA
jgi:hypothetical protein